MSAFLVSGRESSRRPRWYSVVPFCVSGVLVFLSMFAGRGMPLIPWPLRELLFIAGCLFWLFALLSYSRDLRPRSAVASALITAFALIAGIGNLFAGVFQMLMPLWRH